MLSDIIRPFLRSRRAAGALRPAAAAAAVLLVSCGGGASNPFGNPGNVGNPPLVAQQKLAFAYFEKCINPIFLKQIQLNGNTNTCAGAGCHASATGSGGAFRIVPTAPVLDVTDPANTAAVIQASDIYKNFYSAQGEVIVGTPLQSRIILKPLVLGVLHGGGLIFQGQNDPNVVLMEYWITHPAPIGQDEFSPATYSMFTNSDPVNGTCLTQ
jgi:hypothetical protein